MKDKLNAVESANISISSLAGANESCQAEGVYNFKCFEYEGGPLLWEETFNNVVCTLGKNLMLTSSLKGSAYTVVGPYMGLISSVSYTTGPAASDTMASHGGWTEAGTTNAPTFSARVAVSLGTAASGAISNSSTPTSFTMTGSGTLKGAFIAYGTGAVTTILDANGTMLSAGLFTGGDQPVTNGNIVQVTYTISL